MSYESYFSYSIYAIFRTDNHRPLYVGMTYGDLKSRLKSHIWLAKSGRCPNNAWLNWLRQNPDVEIDIEEVARGVGVPIEASAHERRIIKKYLYEGHKILNSTNGANVAPRSAKATSHVCNQLIQLRKTEYYGLFAA